MRFALVSDIHGNLRALEAVISDMQHRQVSQVINLGDTLSGPLLPRETAQLLSGLPWLHLAGNHERQLLNLPLHCQGPSDAYIRSQLTDSEMHWLAGHAQPSDDHLQGTSAWADLLGSDVAVCHGSPRSDVEYLMETPVGEEVRLATAEEINERVNARLSPHITLLACGHTHIARAIRIGSGLLIVNPGSVGLPAYDDDHCHPMSAYHRIENGSPDARYAIVERLADSWVCEFINVPYDHESMAALAELRGRHDWAFALRTGRMPRKSTEKV